MTTLPRAGIDVALLNPCYWPEVRRGSERFIRDLASGLIEDGHRPHLITSHKGPPSRTNEDGLEVIRVPRPPEGLLRDRMFESYLTHVPLSYAALRLRGGDLAHAMFATDACAAARWTERTGRPSVFSYMGIPERWWLTGRRLRLKTTLRAVRDCSAVVALSRTAAESFRRNLGVEARVISPGVDTTAFAPGGSRAPDPTIFCASDATEPAKRVPDLVRAFRIVRRERPAARLLLSWPPDRRAAETIVAGEDGVSLVEVDDRDALRDAYRSAWVSALPSYGEAFGLVLIESLACGTPVVGRRGGAIPEVVDRESVGRLFDGDEDEALARALLEAFELAEEPGTAGACRERGEDFSVRSCVEAYERLYAELLAR